MICGWILGVLRFTLILTPCISYCSDVNNIFAYAHLQTKIQRYQKALVPSHSGRRSKKEWSAKTRTPTQTVNEHGTVPVATIIIILASITNIISGVSNPG